jgi:hypothetical protein
MNLKDRIKDLNSRKKQLIRAIKLAEHSGSASECKEAVENYLKFQKEMSELFRTEDIKVPIGD